MAFSKSYPRRSDKSVYPNWDEVYLTDEEEKGIEEEARLENIRLFSGCLQDARKLMHKEGLRDIETNLVRIATALFEKRASHSVFWKESKAKEKFDSLNKSRSEKKQR